MEVQVELGQLHTAQHMLPQLLPPSTGSTPETFCSFCKARILAILLSL